MWTRWELATSQGTVLSFAVLDCAEGRDRDVQVVEYAERDLKGSVVSSLPETLDWTYEPPGTLGDRTRKVVCGS